MTLSRNHAAFLRKHVAFLRSMLLVLLNVSSFLVEGICGIQVNEER
jgi:hypothetical protein